MNRMHRPPLDVAAVAIGLAAVAFGVVLYLSPSLPAPLIQPILAVALATAGLIGLLLTRGRNRTSTRKDLP